MFRASLVTEIMTAALMYSSYEEIFFNKLTSKIPKIDSDTLRI